MTDEQWNDRDRIDTDHEAFLAQVEVETKLRANGRPAWMKTPTEAAKLYNRSLKTIRAWMLDGSLKSIASPYPDSDRIIHLYELVQLNKRSRKPGSGRRAKPKLLEGEARAYALDIPVATEDH